MTSKCEGCGGCTCTEPLHHSPYGHCLLGCPATSPSNLTFAAAMALDPGDVEFKHPTGDVSWHSLHVMDGCSLKHMRQCIFRRRARPRRSRVQEMAERGMERESGKSDVETIATHAIRAVCEYLRTKQAEEMAGPCKRSLPETQAVWAARIEREFLEER